MMTAFATGLRQRLAGFFPTWSHIWFVVPGRFLFGAGPLLVGACGKGVRLGA